MHRSKKLFEHLGGAAAQANVYNPRSLKLG
jgi:hypothetical protein